MSVNHQYYIQCMTKHEKLIADEIIRRLGHKLSITSSVKTHQTEGKQTKRGVVKYRTDANLPGYIILTSDCIIPYHVQTQIQQEIRLVVGGKSQRVIYNWMDASDNRKIGLRKNKYGRNVYCASPHIQSH